MATITRVGFSVYQNTGTANVPETNPSGAASGDKMLLALTVSAVAASISDLAGWTLLLDVTYNSRRTFILTRNYAATYPNIVLSTAATAASAISALRAAPGYTLSSPVAGTKWDRPTDGGGSVTNTTMKSMTGRADGIVIAITAETSTAAETEAQVTFTGTGWSKWAFGDSDPASDVAANFWFGYRDLGAVASGDVSTTWPNASNNSMGVQVSVGQTGGGTTPTGNLDTTGIFQHTATSLTVGARKLGGGVVEAVLRRGGVEVARQEMAFTSGRGSTTFTGLPAGMAHTVTFEVDDVVQTDVAAAGRTLRTGPASFSALTGSCMFTASMHPIFDAMAAELADFYTVQGDAHYEDQTTAVGWWNGMALGLNSWRGLPRKMVTRWTPDNHDTIRTTPLGGGAPELPPIWKQIAGANGWGSVDSVGQAWQNGRVLFIQPDMRSARANYQTDPAPLQLLGTAQEAWLTGLLNGAEADSSVALVIWLDSWIGLQQTSGRWGSYPEAYGRLNAIVQGSAWLKSHLVLIGGDTHNLWADSGARSWPEAAFPGVPSLNMSGFNRAADAETFFIPDIANASLISSGVEADWGGYSRITITDVGGDTLGFQWDAVRVNSAGTPDTMASWSKVFSAGGDVPPDPEDYATMSNRDLEIHWLRFQTGRSDFLSVQDLRYILYSGNERAYWAARSGLTSGSLSDHKITAMRNDTGLTGTLSDVSRAYWAKNSV